MAADTAGDTPRGGALGGLWRRAVGWPGRVQAWWSDLSADGQGRVVRRVGAAFAGIAVVLFLALAVGFGYLAVQVVAAFAAIRDLDYNALKDDTLVVVFRNLLWGVAAAAGATVAAIGVGLAAWRTVTQHRQSQIEQRRVETETFSKAMELLGNETFAIRLGGILQLETLAQQSRRLHWPIMEAFCAYLREQRPVETVEKQADETDAIAPFPSDLQAIVTAIGRRNRRHDPAAARLPLERIDLSGANLSGAHLERAQLQWAPLERADLERAHLEGADLFGAHLEGADLFKAHLERAQLPLAHLEGALLDRAHLEGADLERAHLEGANLYGAHLDGADLERAHLDGADLQSTDVTQEQIDEARGDSKTQLPQRLTRPEGWTVQAHSNVASSEGGPSA
jgi:hypothetical protein